MHLMSLYNLLFSSNRIFKHHLQVFSLSWFSACELADAHLHLAFRLRFRNSCVYDYTSSPWLRWLAVNRNIVDVKAAGKWDSTVRRPINPWVSFRNCCFQGRAERGCILLMCRRTVDRRVLLCDWLPLYSVWLILHHQVIYLGSLEKFFTWKDIP